MNEVAIPVKLEHENGAKLLGYCTEGTRLFLAYDFALHATLGCLIYDMNFHFEMYTSSLRSLLVSIQSKECYPACTILKWDKRYKIILGVAKALLYLHKDAPIQIVHGDVKPENILLDENLNPALSGFQYARAINESNYIHVDEICGTISEHGLIFVLGVFNVIHEGSCEA
ncbi:cysteine-rich receptor-like protein kinase 44 [Bidens hawaiensis]|uniref:cysteine-rich receptor-like protein kinase 44 n=1 Tax=Bidens hawaiensis TaxID=980011 RepID=UPI00404B407B